MKKVVVQVLLVSMVVSMVACGKKTESDVSDKTTSDSFIEEVSGEVDLETQSDEATDEETKDNEDKDSEEKDNKTEDTDSKDDKPKPSVDSTSGNSQGNVSVNTQTGTSETNAGDNNQNTQGNASQTPPANQGTNGSNIAQSVVNDFKSKARTGNYSAGSMANALLSNPKLDFNGATMNVSPGPLNGFKGNIKGFSEGATFGPVIGTIPFIGYVFKLDNPDNAQSLLRNLRANADPNWNICTCADDIASDVSGDMVVFVMSPREF